MDTPRRIAIWNTAFLGDAVLTLPLIRIVKTAFPSSKIDFYVRHGFAPLFAAQSELDAAYEPPKDRSPIGLWNLIKDIRRRGYDLWISPHTSFRSALIALSSGAAIRIGFSGGIRNMAFTHTTGRGFGLQDEIERVLNLTVPLFDLFPASRPGDFDAGDPADPLHHPKIVLPPTIVTNAETFINRLSGSGPLLGIHPGSVWPTKRWPPAHFAAVGKMALDAGARVLLFATPAERASIDAVLDAGLRGLDGVTDVCGMFDLPHLAAVIARLDAYLTNDSGPMHLAWSQGVPVTAIFGPTVRALGFAPRGGKSSVIELHDLPCRPCGLHGSTRCPKGHFKCMTDVRPEDAWADLKPKLFIQGEGK